MSNRSKVKAGDVIEVNVRLVVHNIQRHEAGTLGPAFTSITYATSEPKEDGSAGGVFALDVPNGFGRITILGVEGES